MTNKSNAQKAAQLGMPFGTANGKLRKMILFSLVQRFGLDECYRCGLKIKTIDEFSIEHKKDWLNVDPALFWDLDNIAYSHLNCNVAAARKTYATLCWMCGVNPVQRRKPDAISPTVGRGDECPPCHTKRMQEYRRRKKINGL